MSQLILLIAKQLGWAIGGAIVAATTRYLEKKSIIKHFKKKLEEMQAQCPDEEKK